MKEKDFSKCVVITGAPCSGKTSLITELAKNKYQTCPEAATIYLSDQISKGRSLPDIAQDRIELERAIIRIALANEAKIDTDEWCFMDRSALDLVAYSREGKVIPVPYYDEIINRRYYPKIFLLERFRLLDDRMEKSDEEAAALESLLYEVYSEQDYEVIRVPIESTRKRITLIFNKLGITRPF